MPKNQINLTWLRTFEAASRYLNFTATAAELNLTQTAVSLHIRTLEEQLGSRLFQRNARHLSLTDVGQAYVSTVRQALADIDLATTSLFGAKRKETITVKAPISTSALWLAPRLPKFKLAHPDVDVRLVSNIWTDATGLDDVDVELRVGRGDWTDIASQRLSDDVLVPVGPVQDSKTALDADALLKGPFIRVLGQEADWIRYLAARNLVLPEGLEELYVDTMIAAIELAANGGGYAVILKRLVEMANAPGRRVAIIGPDVSTPNAFYLMQPRSKRSRRPVVLLFENWLREQFSAGGTFEDASH